MWALGIESRDVDGRKRVAVDGDLDELWNDHFAGADDVERRTEARWRKEGSYFDAVAFDDPLIDPAIRRTGRLRRSRL